MNIIDQIYFRYAHLLPNSLYAGIVKCLTFWDHDNKYLKTKKVFKISCENDVFQGIFYLDSDFKPTTDKNHAFYMLINEVGKIFFNYFQNPTDKIHFISNKIMKRCVDLKDGTPWTITIQPKVNESQKYFLNFLCLIYPVKFAMTSNFLNSDITTTAIDPDLSIFSSYFDVNFNISMHNASFLEDSDEEDSD